MSIHADNPYRDMSMADVLYDFGRVRGDLVEQYARTQLLAVIESKQKQAIADVLNAEADELIADVCDGNYNPDKCETCRAVEALRRSAEKYALRAVRS